MVTGHVDRAGRVARERVRVGIVGRDEVEVVAGLRAGDTVLLAAPGATLRVGARWVAP